MGYKDPQTGLYMSAIHTAHQVCACVPQVAYTQVLLCQTLGLVLGPLQSERVYVCVRVLGWDGGLLEGLGSRP